MRGHCQTLYRRDTTTPHCSHCSYFAHRPDYWRSGTGISCKCFRYFPGCTIGNHLKQSQYANSNALYKKLNTTELLVTSRHLKVVSEARRQQTKGKQQQPPTHNTHKYGFYFQWQRCINLFEQQCLKPELWPEVRVQPSISLHYSARPNEKL